MTDNNKIIKKYNNQEIETSAYLPLNMGDILKIPKPPTLRYWPMANSKKNIGMPAHSKVNM